MAESHAAEPTPDRRAHLRMAEATRRIIDEHVTTTADHTVLERAAALVEEAVALLEGEPHGRSYVGVAEGSLADHHTSFVDFSPFTGALNPLAPPMTFDLQPDVVIAEGVFGAAYEGPPGCLHGGYIAAAFDEVLGFTQALTGSAGMTGKLEISYRRPTPLYRTLRFEGRVTNVSGRKILTHATLHDGETLCAEATGLFISLKPEAFEGLLRDRVNEG